VFILDLTVGLGALRHALLPAWVGAISLAYAAYETARSPTLFGRSGTFAPAETINVNGTLGFLVWAIVVGVGLAQRGKDLAPTATTAPTWARASTVEFLKPYKGASDDWEG
jgi:hypothetical protein